MNNVMISKNKKLFFAVIIILASIGAINWGFVGAFDINLVTLLFGALPTFVNLIYVLVGLSGIFTFVKAVQKILP